MTVTDHYQNRSIDDLATIRQLINRLIASLPLDTDLIVRLGTVLNQIDESVTAKRLAAPTPLLPRQQRNL